MLEVQSEEMGLRLRRMLVVLDQHAKDLISSEMGTITITITTSKLRNNFTRSHSSVDNCNASSFARFDLSGSSRAM